MEGAMDSLQMTAVSVDLCAIKSDLAWVERSGDGHGDFGLLSMIFYFETERETWERSRE